MGQDFATPEGQIVVSNEVIATIAGLAAMECYGVVGMAARGIQDGLARLLGRENLSRGVNVEITDDQVIITLGVIVGYGMKISEVARNIVHQVRYAVEKATGLQVTRVIIDVQGVRIQK
ncbi:MAG: Asp23/Gls24 family envelope stress response protein [Thermaerobacterales bacterium]